MADFCGFQVCRNKIAKRRLTESCTAHICPVTEAALTDLSGSVRIGRHDKRMTGPPV